MNEISVHEILLKHKNWIDSDEFVSLVSKKRNVGPRQVYYLIKEAYEKKEIKKHIFPDRTVWYGLAEFGPPEAVKKVTFRKRLGFLGSFFDYWNKRAERKRLEEERQKKERLARKWNYMELVSKTYPKEFAIYKDVVEIQKKTRKEAGLDKEQKERS